jgi:beta-phosphoglucomutase-like phosphatase (HAD superfamily)
MTADDVRYVKPNPELYHAAVEALDVAPDEAIAIEDSHNGMLAARGAGLFCVVCPNELTRNQSFELAHLRVDSLAQIPLSELLRLLASRRASHEGAG